MTAVHTFVGPISPTGTYTLVLTEPPTPKVLKTVIRQLELYSEFLEPEQPDLQNAEPSTGGQ